MNEIEELINRINIEQQCLANHWVDKQNICAMLDIKRNNFNSLVDGYKNSFLTVEQASFRIQQLDAIKRRLSDLQAVPMQNMHQEIERLKSEALSSYNKIMIDTEAPEISREEMEYMLRIIGHGHTWEDKDKTIHNLQKKLDERSNTLRNTNTNLIDHSDELKDKDSIIHHMKQNMETMKQMLQNFTDELFTKNILIHNMKQEIEDMKQRLDKNSQRGYLMNPGFQPPDSNVAVSLLYPRHTPYIQTEECHDISRLQEELQHSKQMIEELKNETKTRQQDVDRLEQDILSLSEELRKTKADQERNHGGNASVNNNYFGQTNVMYGISDNTQIGNQNMMRILANNVQQSPWESGN